MFNTTLWFSLYILYMISNTSITLHNLLGSRVSALRSIKENVRKRSPTVRLISTVRGEHLQPIANAF